MRAVVISILCTVSVLNVLDAMEIKHVYVLFKSINAVNTTSRLRAKFVFVKRISVTVLLQRLAANKLVNAAVLTQDVRFRVMMMYHVFVHCYRV